MVDLFVGFGVLVRMSKLLLLLRLRMFVSGTGCTLLAKLLLLLGVQDYFVVI